MKSMKTSVATLNLIENQIIHFIVDDNAEFGLEDMLEVRAANIKLSDGQPYCVAMEAGNFSNFSEDVRKASASPEHTKNRIALALIHNNLATRLIFNFYLAINSPVGKTKAFQSKEKALLWLRKMRDRHNKVALKRENSVAAGKKM